jgi:CMP-N-acetylneuraminic acid synthetase
MKAHSERVSGKNMRQFCGRPLFHWILESLSDSGVIDEIIINTDSEEIAKNAAEYFDVTIHMRPDYLLDISSNEAYQIMAYDLEHTDGEYFIQSHSTNPLVKGETIRMAIDTFFSNIDKHDSLFSVTPLQTRIFDNNHQAMNHDPNKLIKTQDMPFIYEENSCIYIFSRESFIENKNRIGKKSNLYPMDRFEAIDIDEEFDFVFAEMQMTQRLDKR